MALAVALMLITLRNTGLQMLPKIKEVLAAVALFLVGLVHIWFLYSY